MDLTHWAAELGTLADPSKHIMSESWLVTLGAGSVGVNQGLRKCVPGACCLLWLPRQCSYPLAALRLCPWTALGQAPMSACLLPHSPWGLGWGGSGGGTAWPVPSPAEPLPLARLQGVVCPPPCVSRLDLRRAGVQARGRGRTARTAQATGLRRGQREEGALEGTGIPESRLQPLTLIGKCFGSWWLGSSDCLCGLPRISLTLPSWGCV